MYVSRLIFSFRYAPAFRRWGAVWCGIVNELVNFFRQQLSLPEEVLPVALVAVGHPAEERPVPERYDPSHVHFEAYQSKN